MIPKTFLDKRIAELIDNRKKAKADLDFIQANVHAYDGAIKECRLMLACIAEADARASDQMEAAANKPASNGHAVQLAN